MNSKPPVIIREDRAARFRDLRKVPPLHGDLFGVHITDRGRDDPHKVIGLHVEDDENWHFVVSFSHEWLPELIRILETARAAVGQEAKHG
jgi:hypothetical protein